MDGGTVVNAIVVESLGGPEQLVLSGREPPSPGEGQIAVEVAAAGVNFIDTYHRSGLYPVDLPFVPGLEGSGVVREVGEGVAEFEVGDRVGWVNALGSYATHLALPADAALRVPAGVDLETAAAVLLQGITAHYLAVDTFPLRGGHRCLVHAGAGGVGLLLTQIAKKRGAEVVTTVGTDEKAELSRQAGADDVIVYTRVDFADACRSKYGDDAFDVVYDGVGADTFEKGLGLLRPRGTMVTFGNASGPPPDISPLELSRGGSLFLTRPTMFHYIADREELRGRADDLFRWVSAGELRVRVGNRFPLEDAADAHRALEGRATTGKVLLLP